MFPLGRFRVRDRSMEPALAAGDFLLVNRWAYALRIPAVDDIVVLKDPERPGRFLVKRIVGSVRDEFVVAGDNRATSRDSRAFGPIARDLIVGKVWKRVAP